MQPLSGRTRTIDHKTREFNGPSRRRGITWWLQKEDRPFFRFGGKPDREPFKVRLLREDPAGTMLSLVEEGKLELRTGDYNGKRAAVVSLPKPKAWWRIF